MASYANVHSAFAIIAISFALDRFRIYFELLHLAEGLKRQASRVTLCAYSFHFSGLFHIQKQGKGTGNGKHLSAAARDTTHPLGGRHRLR